MFWIDSVCADVESGFSDVVRMSQCPTVETLVLVQLCPGFGFVCVCACACVLARAVSAKIKPAITNQWRRLTPCLSARSGGGGYMDQ